MVRNASDATLFRHFERRMEAKEVKGNLVFKGLKINKQNSCRCRDHAQRKAALLLGISNVTMPFFTSGSGYISPATECH